MNNHSSLMPVVYPSLSYCLLPQKKIENCDHVAVTQITTFSVELLENSFTLSSSAFPESLLILSGEKGRRQAREWGQE